MVRMLSLVAILTVSAIFTALLRGTVGNAMMKVAPGVRVKFNTCTGPADQSAVQPTWFVNGKVAETEGDCYKSTLGTAEGRNYTATLTINGNRTCDTFNVYCRIYRESQALYLHNTIVTFQGRLPSPENLHINVNSPIIEWKPSYSAMSNDTVHVDPHITQYTVYTTDNYTGNIVTENVTETHFTYNTSDDGSCLMYQVSAWNSGGEGELSEPIQESTLQVPHRIAAENITVAYTVKPNGLHIHIDVNNVCTRRIPKLFFITLMMSAGGVLNMSHDHDPGQPVADFNISLPPSVDVCSLHVRISAGNSAGMSAPSEAVEVGCPDGSTHSTQTTSTESGEDLTTLIVFAVVGGVVAMAAMAGIICCTLYRKYKRRKNKGNPSDLTQNYYSKSPSLCGPVPLYKPPVPEVVYVTSEQTTSTPVARDPEHTAIRMQTLDSTPSTLRTGSSTESGHSADLLLPPSPPAPAKGSHLVFAQLEAVKQTQVLPPASDDPVQHAQIEHHES